MNHKQATADPVRAQDEILVEIDGLIPSPEGKFYFVLKGVKPVDLGYEPFETMTRSMVEQGVNKDLAARLIDEAHGTIQTGLLAHALAQRTRRVG